MVRSVPVILGVFLLVTLVAFWPSYLARPFGGIDRYTHAHAALMSLWFLALIGQPILIRTGRRHWHRRIGRASLVLVPIIVIAAALLVHVRVSAMDDATLTAESSFFFLPFRAVVLFVVAYALAIAHRDNVALHSRYMVCTAIALVDAVVARLLGHHLPPLPSGMWYPGIGFALSDLLLVALWWHDRAPAAVRRVYAVMLAWYVAFDVLWYTVAQTSVWTALVRAYRAFPLTG